MMINWKKFATFLFVVFVLLIFSILNSVWAASSLWSQTYGGEKVDKAFCAVETPDGGIALAGETRSFGSGVIDFWLIKTDSNGNVEWNKTYGGSGMETAYSVIVTSDGGFALAGSTYSFGSGGSDFWLVKTDSYGNMEWNQTYGEDIHDTGLYYAGPDDECATFLIQTNDGGYFLVGYKIHYRRDPYNPLIYRSWVVKTDSNGKKVFSQTYGTSTKTRFSSLIETPDKGFIVVGSQYDYESIDAYLWFFKIDSHGTTEWDHIYRNEVDNGGSAIVATSDGGYVIGGGTNMFPDENKNVWLVKIDSNGDSEWIQKYADDVDLGASSLAVTSDGGFIIAGNSIVVKTDAQGNMQWNQTYDGLSHSVVATSDGGYLLAGSTQPVDGSDDVDFWLAKTDSMGIPEFPTWTILPMLLTVALVLTIYKNQLAKTPNCL